MNLHIPKIKIHNHLQPKWYTSEINHHIKCLRTLCHEYKHHPTEHRAAAIKNSERDLESKINNAKLAYESNLVNNFSSFNNSSIIYNHIWNITKTKSIPSIITFDDKQACDDSEKANLFNNYFYSVFTSPNNAESPNIDSLPNILNSLSMIDISEVEVYLTLCILDPKKLVGADKIGPMILKFCSDASFPPVFYVFEICYNSLFLEDS